MRCAPDPPAYPTGFTRGRSSRKNRRLTSCSRCHISCPRPLPSCPPLRIAADDGTRRTRGPPEFVAELRLGHRVAGTAASRCPGTEGNALTSASVESLSVGTVDPSLAADAVRGHPLQGRSGHAVKSRRRTMLLTMRIVRLGLYSSRARRRGWRWPRGSRRRVKPRPKPLLQTGYSANMQGSRFQGPGAGRIEDPLHYPLS